MSDTQYAAAIEYARALGEEHGRNAASWIEYDQTPRLARLLDDGDPVVYDELPSADLSGEWAGALTGPDLYAEALQAAGMDPDETNEDAPDWFTDVCDAYSDAFSLAVEDDVQLRARTFSA